MLISDDEVPFVLTEKGISVAKTNEIPEGYNYNNTHKKIFAAGLMGLIWAHKSFDACIRRLVDNEFVRRLTPVEEVLYKLQGKI